MLESALTRDASPAPPATAPLKGIAPKLLVHQIENTAPFIFAPDFEVPTHGGEYLKWVRELQAKKDLLSNSCTEWDPVEYFRLCLTAHWSTVATFVPTDVDNAIRFKLWDPNLPTDVFLKMADVVLEALNWNYSPVSIRVARSPKTGNTLSGHEGEWFSVAAAAYGALRRRKPERAGEVAEAIHREISRQEKILSDLLSANQSIPAMAACCLIAHNLGDLDRVIDLWNLADDDALRLAVYKAGHEKGKSTWPLLGRAGEFNKARLANENHRHFVLREPRFLRTSREYLLPMGPFFDDWGARLASHPGVSPENIGELSAVLIQGWERLPDTVGYTRALAGIESRFPGGISALAKHLPSRAAKNLKSGRLRVLCSTPRDRFENQWIGRFKSEF